MLSCKYLCLYIKNTNQFIKGWHFKFKYSHKIYNTFLIYFDNDHLSWPFINFKLSESWFEVKKSSHVTLRSANIKKLNPGILKSTTGVRAEQIAHSFIGQKWINWKIVGIDRLKRRGTIKSSLSHKKTLTISTIVTQYFLKTSP